MKHLLIKFIFASCCGGMLFFAPNVWAILIDTGLGAGTTVLDSSMWNESEGSTDGRTDEGQDNASVENEDDDWPTPEELYDIAVRQSEQANRENSTEIE